MTPSESAIRRTLQRVDPDTLDQVVSGWLAAALTEPGPRWRAVAVDGTSARGARTADGRAVHLLAAFEHADGVVLGQTVVDGKTNEISAFAPLLERIDITPSCTPGSRTCPGGTSQLSTSPRARATAASSHAP